MARFYTETVDGVAASIVRVEGPVTVASGPMDLRQTVASAFTDRTPNVVLDLRDLTTIDSSGIGELVGSYTLLANRGGNLRLSGVPRKFRELLEITQLIRVFEVHDSNLEAVAAIAASGRQESSPVAALENLSFRADSSSENLLLPRVIDSTQILVEHLLREPRSIYDLPPRRFEELIAELVSQFGWRVQLTPQTHDGGRDMIALIPSDVGDILCLIEAKRYREDRKIGVDLVRQLWGTVSHDDASLGLLVTSSSFSREAREFQQAHQARLRLRENSDVFDWLRIYRGQGWRRPL